MRPLLTQAEVLAWPLADEASFWSGDATLPAAHKLPEGLRERLARHPPVGSAGDLCRHAWGDARTLRELLKRYADDHLEPAGPCARPKLDPDAPGRELLRWRAVSLMMPPAVLLAWVPGAPERVALLDRALAPPGPAADLHLHLSAAGRFSHLWEALAAEHNLRALGPRWPGRDPEVWDPVLDAALCFRGLFCPSYDPLLDSPELARSQALAPLLPRGRPEARRPDRPGRSDLALRARRERNLRETHARAADRRHHAAPSARSMPEAEVQAAMWRWAARRVEPNAQAERLVVQYLRVQTRLYRTLTMDPTGSGLDTFREHFDRLRPLHVPRDALLARALAEGGDGLELAAVEARVSPPEVSSSLDLDSARLRGAVEHLPSRVVPETGLVVHLVRTPRPGEPLASLVGRLHAQADRLAQLFSYRPALLEQVCGLDLAGDERQGPFWAVRGALRRVLDAAIAAAARLPRDPGGPIAPGARRLGLTVHVGEDFPHLLTGLRNIGMVLDSKLLRRGDRLGHALAALQDPERWFQGRQGVVMPRVERLLDLCWVIRLVRREGVEVSPGTVARWEEERERQGKELCPGWGADSAAQVLEAFTSTHAARELLGGGLPTDTGRLLLHRWLHHRPGRGDHGAAPIDGAVELREEGAVEPLRVIQDHLRRRISRTQLCVESNPTSNLLIGALHGPMDLPGLAPLAVDEDPGALPIAIAADDPLTFATGLADEYAYAWAGLVCQGRLTPERARERLGQAAAASWRFRFTTPPRAGAPIRGGSSDRAGTSGRAG